MDSNQRLRARIALGGIIVAAFFLVMTLFSIQIERGSEYAAKGEKQYISPLRSTFDRGSIFFTAKDGTRSSAATLASNYVLYMSPKDIRDPKSTYQALSQYIDIDEALFLQKAYMAGDPYEELAKKVSPDVAKSIMEISLTGIGVTKETVRTYPGGKLASHALGIIGERERKIAGRYGLERTFEETLNREDSATSANMFAQLFTNIHDSIFSGSENIKGDIITTIEPTVQGYLEKTLSKTSLQWKPDEIGGIIMDPSTGDIIALAALPDFDPNNTSGISSINVLSNPLVESAYEMGSIMKPLTVAVGFDSGAINSTWTYDDTGTMTLSGKKIANFDGKARGVVPVQEILSQSLNVGSATVALEVGKQEFVKYFKSFGFGEKTGIDQPNETVGLVANLETGRDIEIATMAYGQGIALSPIAITRALATLANDGKLVRPRLVQEVDYIDGTKNVIAPNIGPQVFKPESVETVTRMLVKVVDEALRGGALKMEHYSIAAKTGTAQIPDPATKGYYQDRYLHSFFGYFPAYEPKFIVFLYQKYPKGAQYASETLVEPFGELTRFLIDYYDVTPDR